MQKNVHNVHSEPRLFMKEFVTPKQIARAIGVSESSLKRWCDKGVLQTVRTAGGHRRIRMSSVFEFLRQTQQSLAHPELLGLPAFVGQPTAHLDRARAQLRTALEAGDEPHSRRLILQLYLAGHSLCEICERVIAGVFHEIGDDWQCGAIEVYQERRACEIVAGLLHELRSTLSPAPAAAPLAIGGTLSGDPYQLASKIVELVLREAGWRATCYGSSLPVATWCAAVRAARPRLLWVSVSHIPVLEDFLSDYLKLFEVTQEHGVALLVGGRALTPELRQQMPYSAYCDTFRHVTSFANLLYCPISPTDLSDLSEGAASEAVSEGPEA